MEKSFTAGLNQGHRGNDVWPQKYYLNLINANKYRPVGTK